LEVLPEIYEHVKKRMKKNNPAHDFEHALRVCQNAENLCIKEKANKKLVLYAALLHDIVSYPKNHKNDERIIQDGGIKRGAAFTAIIIKKIPR